MSKEEKTKNELDRDHNLAYLFEKKARFDCEVALIIRRYIDKKKIPFGSINALGSYADAIVGKAKEMREHPRS